MNADITCIHPIPPNDLAHAADHAQLNGHIYQIKDAAGTLSVNGFAPTGVTCAAGHLGTVTYTTCTSHNAEYTLGGCTGSVLPRLLLPGACPATVPTVMQ